MKILYLECAMGAAGDMLMASLSELIPNADKFIEKINGIGLHGITVSKLPSVKCGITGTYISVTVNGHSEDSSDVHNHEHEHHHEHRHEHHNEHSHLHHEHEHHHEHNHDHHHSGLHEIEHIIDSLNVSEFVKSHAIEVYKLIAEAESHAHGKPVSEIHFHEVGTLDAIADIVGVCMLIEEIAPDKIIVSPVNLGSGHVHCAHGILPVPAPATAYIMREAPAYSSEIKGELCTPTGAALLKHFASEFASMKPMITEKIGYGMGKKDFPAANCVRAFLGHEFSENIVSDESNGEVAELECNIDDMTGEALGFAQEILFEHGALDVFTVPIQMKKSRPAYMLVCICNVSDSDKMAKLMLAHTTTFGVRRKICRRYMLDRSFSKINTEYGEITIKTGTGYGIEKSKPEYSDIASAAKKSGVPLSEIIR